MMFVLHVSPGSESYRMIVNRRIDLQGSYNCSLESQLESEPSWVFPLLYIDRTYEVMKSQKH
jgi:hypothetical protein